MSEVQNVNNENVEQRAPRKHTRTWYNRHMFRLLMEVYFQLKENNNVDGMDLTEEHFENISLSVESLNEVTEDKLRFSIDSLCIHLRTLQAKGFIKLSAESKDIEDIKNMNISLTLLGRNVVYILKDVKFTSIYRANPKHRQKDKVVSQHTKTFYNRHAVQLLNLMLSENIEDFKEAKEESEDVSFEDYKWMDFSFEDLNERVHYSEESLKLHLKYLENKNLIKTNEEDKYELTEFGLVIGRVLKDIKYQSLYNIGAARLKKD
tara:strand:- start:55202 stop:55990 length:789 start_codon:yes stop_codon:yes gene_type:complete